MHEITACPICDQTAFLHYITCEDHTVSHQKFSLDKCVSCGFVFTNPRPTDKDLPTYYQSDAYISHSNRSATLIDKAYKFARTFTLKWKYNLIRKNTLVNPKSILDFGCGTGAFLEHCRTQNLKIFGVEPSESAREQARRNTGLGIKANIAEITGTFDVITLWHVLEHVTDMHATIQQLKSRLNQNGTMFIAVPNLESYDAKEYLEHWAAYDVPRHLWHFSRSTMQRLLQHHQLNLSGTIPMPLDAYYVCLLSEKYRGANNGIPVIFRAVQNAITSNWKAKTSSEYSSLIYIVRK